jgi:hypothetical protein
MLLGLLPQFPGFDTMHTIDACLLIGGTYFNLFAWFPMMRKDPNMKQPLVWTRLVVLLLVLGGLAVSEFTNCTGGYCAWYLNTPTWEWSFLFGMMFNDAILFFLVPEKA